LVQGLFQYFFQYGKNQQLIKGVIMKLLIGMFALVAMTTGCAGMGTKLDAQRAKGVKTVAVIGYEVQQQQPTDNFGFNSLTNTLNNGGIENSPAFQKMALNIYKDLSTQVTAKTGWKVLSYEQLSTNPSYAPFTAAKMSGLRSTSMVGKNTQLIPLKGVLDVAAFRSLNPAQKAEFAKDLGVDAIAVYTIIQTIDQPWLSVGHVNGTASFEYTSRSNLVVYTADSPEPIWQIQNVDGLKTSSKNTPEAPQLDKIATVGFQSAQSSISNLVNNYKVQ
jgi:hypothetical protein